MPFFFFFSEKLVSPELQSKREHFANSGWRTDESIMSNNV